MGNASCSKICGGNKTHRPPVKKNPGSANSSTANKNSENDFSAQNNPNNGNKKIGENGNNQRSTSNGPSKLEFQDEVEGDELDISEGRGTPISECIGGYNFLSGKGIVKKPE